MEYSKLSDDEINNMVGRVVSQRFRTDYCNDPGAAWPIITANKISIYAMSEADKRGRWGAEASHPDDSYHFNDNPLRAAMITFLMMQENQHA
ncbi:phage protein NinX family protein [Cronobacter sakazakii]|uniref:phage protein NinX family protein n=1 Tax=Cronobacter sakazakii TaxID=28141 RepID=UPI001375AC7B|nr:phage protein NinX family protein [Cronobacter sakazakii]NCH18355.1 DUF2591 domain-containing protein [Cronobacter sakazakii]